MHAGRVCHLLFSLLAVVLVARIPAGEPAKKAVPDAKAQAKIEALLQELFKDDYLKAKKDSAAKTRLASTFLVEGRDTDDDPAGRYVLFREARDLAAQAGDIPIAFQAIDDLARDYGFKAGDIFQMKVKALMTASKAVAPGEAYYTVVDSALILLEDALAADHFDDARLLAETAKAAAIKLKSVPLVSSVSKREEEVLAQEKAFAQFKPFAEKLAKDPKDPKANTEMGKYHALRKGNWEVGLPLLSRGSHAGLKSLAMADLSRPSEAVAQIKLAGAWLVGADDKETPEAAKTHMRLRAYYWYQQALATADAKTQATVEKQMLAIMDKVPAEFKVGEILDEHRRYEGHGGPVYAGAFSADGRRAASGGADGRLRLWDTRLGKEIPISRLDARQSRIWAVAYSSDGQRVAAGAFDGWIRVWEPALGGEMGFPAHKDYVRTLAFSPDSKYLLSAGDDRVIHLWNIESRKKADEVRSFQGHDHFVWSVCFSPDGKRVLSASHDKTVRLWDVKSGKELQRLTGHKDTVLSVAFTPDGRRGLSGSTDGTLRLWDLAGGKELRTFTGHRGYVHSVAVSPDGRRALSAGQDHTLRLWDLATGEEIRKLEGHRDQVWSVAFSRDGRFALSCGQDGTVRIWGGAR